MKYKIVTSGKIEEVSLSELSQNLKVQSEVYALSDREIYLGMISHKTLVLFATEFADYALKNYAKKKIPEAEICIHLTRKWLEDLESVSNEQLIAAADAAAAYAAADAANAAYAAYAAADATYAAASAASATAYASHATCDAAYAAGADREKEFLRQGEFIIDFLKCGKHLFLV